jgi:hypothetical protein
MGYNIIVKHETRKIYKEKVMLAPLDNGTIFKKAFTDKTVFISFVKDILGIDIEVDKIETEKKFEPKVAGDGVRQVIFLIKGLSELPGVWLKHLIFYIITHFPQVENTFF